MKEFSHLDSKGNAKMVNIKRKKNTNRKAIAKGKIFLDIDTINMILDKKISKGNVFDVSRIAAIMAIKKTSLLIPMCHSLLIEGIDVDFLINKEKLFIEVICNVEANYKTGVEMEALTGVSIALLTIYDMCKAVDKNMYITDIYLLKKIGGKSGNYIRKEI